MSHVILAETTASVAELRKNPMGTVASGVRLFLADSLSWKPAIKVSRPRSRYTLAELLAQCDASAEISAEDREWIEAPAVGSELL